MAEQVTRDPKDLQDAFLQEERPVRVQNYRLACILACIFMLGASGLDALIYPNFFGQFLRLRLLCASLILFIWWFVTTSFGSRHYRLLGLILPGLPTFFISLMIYETEGAGSPYYGALNLVLLGAGIVLRWTLQDTIIASLEVIAMYLLACAMHGFPTNVRILFNNGYFLLVTGVFVVIASHFYNSLRFREFALRYELDRNRQSLADTNQKLLELDEIKNRFFANISHELRTPLTLLLAPLETMLYRLRHSFDEETRAFLLTMHSNGMRLLKLINDLLDLVRLEAGKIEIHVEPLAVPEFVRGLASAARPVADDKRLILETTVAPGLDTVLADRDKLEKILLNLLFNALKFTPAGGRVALTAEKRGDEFVLIVSDTGVGISPKQLPYVFDRFWQAEPSSKRKYQGVGIGLALVKELVEAQAGSVVIESQEGKGTTFIVRLPYKEPELNESADTRKASSPTESKQATVSSEEWLANLYRRAELFPALTPVQAAIKAVELPADSSLPTILVADDEPDMLRFLKSQLSIQYQVLEAVDGQQAIEKASQFLPDLVLLDMMMPEKDGLQACRELREQPTTQTIPVVLLTARADENTKLDALKAGASDFLSKPFSSTELHVRIRNLVESYEYQRKLAKQNQVLEQTIEQLKQTESQLVESEKMRSLGRLSAGMIHEINNPLNFATTGLFTLRNVAPWVPAEKRPEYLEIVADIEEGIKRVKDIVSAMRGFSYADNQQLDWVPVAEVLTFALRFLSHEWKGKVQIHQDIPEGQAIRANRNRLVQVMLNLLQNSLDSLAQKTFENDKPAIWIQGKAEPGRTILTLRDNGGGIKPEHLDKIFDPFFTTKDVGQGMGLGLSICYRIVQDYQGRIAVKSDPGKFCEVSLEFPAQT